MLRRSSIALVVSLASLSIAASAQEPPKPAIPLAPPKQAGAPAAPADAAKAKRPKVYDEEADAKQQIAAALAKAKRENQRVLIQWGGNWCPWCLLLHATMTGDAQLRKELSYEYQLIHVDAGSGGDKNVDLASSYGADLKSLATPSSPSSTPTASRSRTRRRARSSARAPTASRSRGTGPATTPPRCSPS